MSLRSRFSTKPTHLSRKLIHAARVMGPTLVALTFAGVAHAQGTMDFSGATTLMTTSKRSPFMRVLSSVSADSSSLESA